MCHLQKKFCVPIITLGKFMVYINCNSFKNFFHTTIKIMDNASGSSCFYKIWLIGKSISYQYNFFYQSFQIFYLNFYLFF